MSKVTAPTDGECELLEKLYEQQTLAHCPAEQRARIEDLLWAEEREEAQELEAEELEAQELYEADLLEQVEGWVEYPEEASDDELDNGICLLEDRISKFEKTKTEEPRFGTWAIETQLRVYELWLKNLRDEKVGRHMRRRGWTRGRLSLTCDGEVRVMTEEEVQNDPEMTAQPTAGDPHF
jgi:hypothetical protein